MRVHWIWLVVILGCSSQAIENQDRPALPGAGGAADSQTGVISGSGAPAAMGGAIAAQPPIAIAGAGAAGRAANPPAGGLAGARAQTGGAGGPAGRAGSGVAGVGSAGASGSSGTAELERFSFFVTSLAGMQRLSNSEDGFGGDLRYGQADGLAGADKICSDLAESSMPGAGAKGWRAFLSVAKGPDGGPVHAIDRVGNGPWYDRTGRVVAMTKAALLNARPQGADPVIINDLPNEEGVPNSRPDPSQGEVNNHHFLTGSDASGKLYMNSVNSTCANWTSKEASAGRPRIGFSYIAGNRQHWISGQDEGGCGAGAVLVDEGGSDPSNPIVGSGGGYGGIYCFASMP
jgi:hypothetical protein